MEDMFGKLREQLELLEWPNVYLFKFIVPNHPEKIALANALFDDTAQIVMHPSSQGTYMSISAKELMLDVDSIIAKYEKASLIEGIISL
jgi:putative lipoic acid-binding regulatory protein